MGLRRGLPAGEAYLPPPWITAFELVALIRAVAPTRPRGDGSMNSERTLRSACRAEKSCERLVRCTRPRPACVLLDSSNTLLKRCVAERGRGCRHDFRGRS